jgi:hypothetical protein
MIASTTVKELVRVKAHQKVFVRSTKLNNLKGALEKLVLNLMNKMKG